MPAPTAPCAPTPDHPADDPSSSGPRAGNGRTFRRVFVAPPDLGAAAVGLLFWAESLRPSLLPRPAVMQGVLAAVALLVGYGVAGLVLLAFRAQRRRTGWFDPPERWRRVGRIVLAVVAAVVVLGGPLVWLSWQNSQRDLVSMPHLETSAIVTAGLVSVVVAVVLLALSRVIGSAWAVSMAGWRGAPVGSSRTAWSRWRSSCWSSPSPTAW